MERGVQNLQIPINGRFSGASEDLFPSALVAAGGYLRINSTVGLSANEFFGVPGVCISTLDGLDPAGGGKIVYSPQYAVGGGMWKTTLTIINLENAATAVTLVLNSETGTPIGQPVILPLPPYGRAVLSDPSLFGILPSSSSPTEGYVRLSSSSTRIMGYVRFGDPADMQFQTALPFVSQGKTGALFSQLAQDGEYFTGVAMVNANPAAARVTIEAFRSDGTSAGNGTIDIAADGRQSKVLDQIISNLPPLRKGYFKLTSNQPVISFAVFATRSLSVLSAIPAQ
jgi:hypothetical protein